MSPGPAACRSSCCSRRRRSRQSTSAFPASTFSACRRGSARPPRPSAVPVRDWTALAMIQALRAAQQNLPSMPFQIPEGSDMMARMPGAIAAADPDLRASRSASSRRCGSTPFVLHAQRADESGNVEIIGPRALDFAMVGAARQVLVTVEEIVPVGALHARRPPDHPHPQPGVRDSGGAGRRLAGLLPAVLRHRLSGSVGGLRRHKATAWRDSLRLPPKASRMSSARLQKVRADDACLPCRRSRAAEQRRRPSTRSWRSRIAAELDNDSFASAGAVSPLANVAYRLAKATHAPDMIIATMSCGHLDIAPSPMMLSLIESLDCETAVAHAGGDDTYSTYYQAGAVTHEIVGAAQVDRRGRVNTIALTQARRRHHPAARAGRHGRRRQHAPRLSALRHPPFAAVAGRRGRDRQLGPRAADRGRTRADGLPDRRRRWCSPIFASSGSTRRPGELVVIETMPGVTREQIRDATGFAVTFDADCREVPLPSNDTLAVLRNRIDPLGLRRLEFVSAKERGALIAEILAADRAMVERCIAAQHAALASQLKGSSHDEAVARHVRRTGLLRRHLHRSARRASRRRRGPSRRLDLVRHRDRRTAAASPPTAARSSAWAARTASCSASPSTAPAIALPATSGMRRCSAGTRRASK